MAAGHWQLLVQQLIRIAYAHELELAQPGPAGRHCSHILRSSSCEPDPASRTRTHFHLPDLEDLTAARIERAP